MVFPPKKKTLSWLGWLSHGEDIFYKCLKFRLTEISGFVSRRNCTCVRWGYESGLTKKQNKNKRGYFYQCLKFRLTENACCVSRWQCTCESVRRSYESGITKKKKNSGLKSKTFFLQVNHRHKVCEKKLLVINDVRKQTLLLLQE